MARVVPVFAWDGRAMSIDLRKQTTFGDISVALESQSGIPVKHQTLLASDGNRIVNLEQFRSVPASSQLFLFDLRDVSREEDALDPVVLGHIRVDVPTRPGLTSPQRMDGSGSETAVAFHRDLFEYHVKHLMALFAANQKRIELGRECLTEQQKQMQALQAAYNSHRRLLSKSSSQFEKWRAFFNSCRQEVERMLDLDAIVKRFSKIQLDPALQKDKLRTLADVVPIDNAKPLFAAATREEVEIAEEVESLRQKLETVQAESAMLSSEDLSSSVKTTFRLTDLSQLRDILSSAKNDLAAIEQAIRACEEDSKMLRDGTKVDVGVLEQKRKEHEQLLNAMTSVRDFNIANCVESIAKAKTQLNKFCISQLKRITAYQLEATKGLQSKIDALLDRRRKHKKAHVERVSQLYNLDKTYQKCLEEIMRRKRWGVSLHNELELLRVEMGRVIDLELDKRTKFLHDNADIPRVFFPGVAEDLPVPAVVEYEFDQALPNITTYEPSEKSELPRVAISASSVRVTESREYLFLLKEYQKLKEEKEKLAESKDAPSVKKFEESQATVQLLNSRIKELEELEKKLAEEMAGKEDAAREKAAELQEKLRTLELEKEREAREKEEREHKVQELNAELDFLRKANERMAKESEETVASVQAQLEQEKRQVAEKIKETVIREKEDELISKTRELEDEVARERSVAENAQREAQAELEDVLERLRVAETASQTLTRRFQELTADLTKATAHNAELEKATLEKDAELNRIREELVLVSDKVKSIAEERDLSASSLEDVNKQSHDALLKLRDEVVTLKDEKEALMGRVSALEVQTASLEEARALLETELAQQKNHEAEMVKQEREEAEKKMLELSEMTQNEKEKMDLLTKEKLELIAKLEQSVKEKSDLQKRVEELSAEVTDLQVDRGQLLDRVSELSDTLAASNVVRFDELGDMEKELNNTRDLLNAATQHRDDAKKEVTELTVENERLKHRAKDLERTVTSHEVDLKQKDVEMDELKARYTQLETEFKVVRESLSSEREREVGEFRNAIKESEEAKKELAKQISVMEQTIATHRVNEQEWEERKAEYETKLTSVMDELELIRSKEKDLKDELETIATEKTSLSTILEERQNLESSLVDQIDLSSGELRELRQDKKKLAHQLNVAKKTFEEMEKELQKKLQETEEAAEAMDKELQETREKLQHTHETAEKMKRENEKLLKDLEDLQKPGNDNSLVNSQLEASILRGAERTSEHYKAQIDQLLVGFRMTEERRKELVAERDRLEVLLFHVLDIMEKLEANHAPLRIPEGPLTQSRVGRGLEHVESVLERVERLRALIEHQLLHCISLGPFEANQLVLVRPNAQGVYEVLSTADRYPPPLHNEPLLRAPFYLDPNSLPYEDFIARHEPFIGRYIMAESEPVFGPTAAALHVEPGTECTLVVVALDPSDGAPSLRFQ